MGHVDRASAADEVPLIDLMEAAGAAVADAVTERWPGRAVVVLCGPGDNGGDGLVASRLLREAGTAVTVSLLGDPDHLTGDAARNLERWPGRIHDLDPSLLNDQPVIVDALFGAGLSRPVEGEAKLMIEAMAASDAPICAVDLPSGLNGTTGAVFGVAAQADLTVTFVAKKPGHVLQPGRAFCGELIVADIGTPASALEVVTPTLWENTPDLWRAGYPWPSHDQHKYSRGSALVLGGGEITGASRLTASAAARVGAGLVTVAAPRRVWSIYAGALASIMVSAIGDTTPEETTRDFAALVDDRRITAVAVGPGAGVGAATRKASLAALAPGAHERGVVLDADALTSFEDNPQLLFDAIASANASMAGSCVLTPHDGEFARLFDATDHKVARTRRAASVSGAVVVLKGSDTVVAHPDGRAVINTNAPPDLATGGSGDVLAGLITGLLAQGMAPFEAASASVWLHGAAATTVGPGMIAEDLITSLPSTLRKLKQ